MLTENTQRPKTAMTGAAAARFPLPSRAFLMARAHSPFFFIDWDSVPVCGFPWIHWCAYVNGDFEGDIEFPDDLSRNEHSRLVQGYNSAAKSEPERGVGYVGPCPPDRDHKYTLQVIALDDEPLVEAPFWANELLDACRGHAIDEAGKILPSRC